MLVGKDECYWIVEFPGDFTQAQAAEYEAAFKFADENVREFRSRNRYEGLRNKWWIYRRPGDGVRSAQRRYSRLLCTPMVSKHRIFIWTDPVVQPDKTIYAFACDDKYFFGVLQSRIHEVWARAQGTQVRERESGFRYTPTTCFETFPFPEPTDAQRAAIAAAAKELDTLRNNWLNPPEWTRTDVLEFPGSVDGPWKRYIDPRGLAPFAESAEQKVPVPLAPANNSRQSRGLSDNSNRAATSQSPSAPGSAGGLPAIATVRYPRTVPKDEDCAKHLKKRTLTNLYNDRPTWLALAHQNLDAAVFAAYNWDPAMPDDDLLAALLALNLERAANE